MSINSVFHARTKHVEIDFHFVRDCVGDKCLVVRFVPSSDQLADVLTKPLVSAKFQQLCFKLNVRSPLLNLREGIRTPLAQDSKSQQESCAAQSVEVSNRDTTKKSFRTCAAQSVEVSNRDSTKKSSSIQKPSHVIES